MALASSRAGLDVNRRAFLLGGSAAVVAAVVPAARVDFPAYVGQMLTQTEAMAQLGYSAYAVMAERLEQERTWAELHLIRPMIEAKFKAFIETEMPCATLESKSFPTPIRMVKGNGWISPRRSTAI